MPNPIVHPHPVKRPGFITAAQWIGPDDDLVLQLSYVDSSGQPRTLSFSAGNLDTSKPGICFSGDINDLTVDTILAHVRMTGLISKQIPGSTEWTDSALEGLTKEFQSAIGNFKVDSVEVLDDQCVKMTVKKATGGGPSREVQMDYPTGAQYSFAPSTQLLVVAGAVKAQFPNATHSVAQPLSQNERNQIADYVVGLEPWI